MEKAGAGDASCEGACSLQLSDAPCHTACSRMGSAVEYASSFRFPREGSARLHHTDTVALWREQPTQPFSVLTACLRLRLDNPAQKWRHTGLVIVFVFLGFR